MMPTIQDSINQVNKQIRAAEQQYGRREHSVQLLAVSKTKPIEAISEAIAAGQLSFGENYLQEGVDKIAHFSQNLPDTTLEWHFIGPIQSNKTRPIAENFQWVHSIDRAKVAQRLNDQRPSNLAPLKVLIQVNISGEASKSGTDNSELLALAELISSLPNLTLRGLMAIPEHVADHDAQLRAFKQLATLNNQLKQKYNQIDTLSMGMSGDMQAAIEAGSTMVRIGTAIFGQRDYSHRP